jgi:hypothetical protein
MLASLLSFNIGVELGRPEFTSAQLATKVAWSMAAVFAAGLAWFLRGVWTRSRERAKALAAEEAR